jgi:Concanavalin A-like lectin/glucanases superfamily
MKKLLTFSLIIKFFYANAQTPIAFYPLNGNANDVIGTLHGTVNGATLTTDRFGVTNNAYSFDGNDFISFSAVPTTVSNNWTLSAWVMPSSATQTEGTIVNNGFDDTGNSSNGYCMNIGDGSAGGVGNKLGYVFGLVERNTSGGVLTINNWHHVVMTRLSGTTRFYINGVLIGFTTNANPLIPTQFRIGSSAGIRFFRGAIDDVGVYNVGLTTPQILALYCSSSINPNTLNLTGVAATNQTSSQYIIAPPTSPLGQINIINSGTNIIYKAGKAISLNSGFKANSGSVFKAEIGGCN